MEPICSARFCLEQAGSLVKDSGDQFRTLGILGNEELQESLDELFIPGETEARERSGLSQGSTAGDKGKASGVLHVLLL